LSKVLSTVDVVDRVRFCLHDYEQAVSSLQKKRGLWTSSLVREVIQLNLMFFNFGTINRLPTVLLREIFLMMSVDTFVVLGTVCQEWLQITRSNEIWRPLFQYKFVETNPNHVFCLPQNLSTQNSFYFDMYCRRLADPLLGDKVEVAWKGKFRLETQDVYHGQAWWSAEIVDKHRGQYKIHYPGWDSRWDEWVSKTRLRWANRPNFVDTILAGDIVELWCCGTNVPGAWLEAKVRRVRDGQYMLSKVLATGYITVPRERIRLVRGSSSSKKELIEDEGANEEEIRWQSLLTKFSAVGRCAVC
jgi:hypothetical protein